jgi:uncharacterized membrane protein YcaP (DUF421 family)
MNDRFESWSGLLRILLVGPLAYIGLLSLLRVSGKRTLSKLNAFDLVLTVTIGSTLATALLSRNLALAEGLVAFALILGLQYRELITSDPRLLVRDGRLLRHAMRQERVIEDGILAAIRSEDPASVAAVPAVVMETDGSFSVLSHSASGGAEIVCSMERRVRQNA